MAEALYIYYLPAHYNIKGDVKRHKVNEVLGWMPTPVPMPADLAAALDQGVGSGGPAFSLYKWASLSFLLTFTKRWKELPPTTQDNALLDPWAFRDFVAQVPTEGGGVYGRESLLHLVHPDTFERIFSRGEKARLASAVSVLVHDPKVDTDRQIAQIRAKLVPRFGGQFDFYDADGARALWRPFDKPLDEFIYWAGRFHERPTFEQDERTYKLRIVEHLSQARDLLLSDGDWIPALKRAFGPPNNLTSWQSHDPFLKWCQSDPGQGGRLLRRIWVGDDEPMLRFADFVAHLPKEVVTGSGARTTLASFLLMGQDPFAYPPYRTAAMHAAYRLTKFDPGEEKDEVGMYRSALAFLDRLRERSRERGLELIDRLDAQSVTWSIANADVPVEWPIEDRAAFDRYRRGLGEMDEDDIYDEAASSPAPSAEVSAEYVTDSLVALADELLIDHAALVEIRDLLKSKRQLIAYGPPGTGKTFVALKLAVALAGDKSRVRLVQFHPSYAYEDFVEGYRPKNLNGTPGFELTPGPMKTLAERAIEDPGHDYFLIIDELNRGNVAKIFGELYFLLEYRDEELLLQYSARPFRLPKNLYLIGTMNTADRSIALLDAALRRRFVFQPFFPDRPPVEGVLRRWLARHRPEMGHVADLVDLANAKLADRNSAIGPSFFMNAELDDMRLARAWRHEIMPLLEDHFFDAPDRLVEFELEALRKEAAKPSQAPGTLEVEPPSDGVEPPGSALSVAESD
jgi:MoxR-like ATPase